MPHLPQTNLAVNLGQLKLVFSFDLSGFTLNGTVDVNGRGIPDATEGSGLAHLPLARSIVMGTDPRSFGSVSFDRISALPAGSASNPLGHSNVMHAGHATFIPYRT